MADHVSEEELKMMESAISREMEDITAKALKVRESQAQIESHVASLDDLLGHIRESIADCKRDDRPVISIAEFRRLREEESALEHDSERLREECKKHRELLTKADEKLATLTAQLRQTKHSLDTYRPVRTVLEFKPRDQQRSLS